MYKVFVNNKPLTISNERSDYERNIPFMEISDFHIAIDLLHHSTQSVNIYSADIEMVWDKFKCQFEQIQAAGGVVFNSERKLLWIYRLNKWDLPKGKIEKGESNEQAAVREVEEECGVSNLEIVQQIKTTYHIYYHKEYILKTTYWFEMNYNGNEILIPQAEEGITDLRWISRQNWHGPLNDTYANISDLLNLYH